LQHHADDARGAGKAAGHIGGTGLDGEEVGVGLAKSFRDAALHPHRPDHFHVACIGIGNVLPPQTGPGCSNFQLFGAALGDDGQ
jgi:hypothetical protein